MPNKLRVWELTNKHGQCLARVYAVSRDEAFLKVSDAMQRQTYLINEVLV